MASARRVAAAVVLALCASGCSGLPVGDRVRVVRRISAEGPDLPEARVNRRVAPSPRDGAPPDEIVRGFLTAHTDSRNDRAIARKYLAPQVSWNDDARVTVVSATRTGRAVVAGDRATVPVTMDRVGTISPQGEFRPAPAPARAVTTFHLRRVQNAGWRLSDAPLGVFLGQAEISAAYDQVTLYFPNQARRLVPDPTFLPTSGQLVGNVVRELLAGPHPWLAPAVRPSIPRGTELLDPPSVVDRVVTLNFSRELGRAPQEALSVVVAQLVWTLTEQALQVDAVRVLVEGEALPVAGHGGREQRRTDWLDYAPIPPTGDPRLYFVRDGAPYAVGAGGVTPLRPMPALDTVAVNRSGTTLAGVTRRSGGRQSLVIVDLAGNVPTRTVLTSERISTPTWEPGGDTVWVTHASGDAVPQVVAVPVRPNAVVPVASPVAGPVREVRLSPDGSRAALLVGAGRAATVWVARVERTAAGGRVLADARAAVPSVGGVTAIAFDGATQITFATVARGRPALYRVDVDGYDLVPQRDEGLPRGAVTALGVSSSFPPERVASVGGRVWRRTPGGYWTPLPGGGAAGTYPG